MLLFYHLAVGILGLTVVECVQYGHNYVPVRKDNDVVAANFADVSDIDLISPAFQDPSTVSAGFPNGTEGPTVDYIMDHFLRSIAARNDWVTYQSPDIATEEGRTLPHVYLSLPGTWNGTESQKLKVWIQGGVHGNEPAGDQAVLAFLGKLDANQSYARSILETMDVLLLPRYNADGVAYFQRTLASNLDPNRDHIKLARQQTREIKQLFSEFGPHIAVDMHEFSAATKYGGSYQHAADALFSAAKNLNIDEGIRSLSEDLFAPNMGSALEAAGLRWEPYVTGSSNSTPGSAIRFAEAGSDGKIGRNAMGLTQCIVFLCEMRGIALADQHFQRRTVTGLVMIEAIVQTAADNAERVYQTITTGIDNFVDSDEDIIITDSTEYSNRTFQMVDSQSGNISNVPIQFASTTPVTANLTRARPESYIIPVAWRDLAERLQTSGLEVVQSPQPFRGTVEALNITTLSFDDTYYEGVVPVTVETSSSTKEIELPAGSFIVSTRQRNAALAFIALEPENIDSYVSFNIIPVDVGDEYPVYRLLS